MSYSRRASHANSWYEGSKKLLKDTVDRLFADVKNFSFDGDRTLLGIISPHAGINYSGQTAAYVYTALRNYLYSSNNQEDVTHIFLLGPSHHKSFEGVELSNARQYETPFGALSIDTSLIAKIHQELRSACVPVGYMSRSTDEDEHSIEMQLPFISHILHYPPQCAVPAKERVQLVPILIGWTDRAMEERIGAVLALYFKDPRKFFVLSSDFCHWGSRFQYTFHYKRSEYPAIGDAIIAMDREGMDLLERKDVNGWYDYLAKTHNTICGQRPISVGMAAVERDSAASVHFLHYSQSNRCSGPSDSSVSYASAVITQ